MHAVAPRPIVCMWSFAFRTLPMRPPGCSPPLRLRIRPSCSQVTPHAAALLVRRVRAPICTVPCRTPTADPELQMRRASAVADAVSARAHPAPGSSTYTSARLGYRRSACSSRNSIHALRNLLPLQSCQLIEGGAGVPSARRYTAHEGVCSCIAWETTNPLPRDLWSCNMIKHYVPADRFRVSNNAEVSLGTCHSNCSTVSDGT